jgi:hypothetical protein
VELDASQPAVILEPVMNGNLKPINLEKLSHDVHFPVDGFGKYVNFAESTLFKYISLYFK